MYTGIRLLLLFIPLFLHFSFSVENWSGQMYHVYRNQAAAAYLSLYFFIFLSLKFSALKFFPFSLFSETVRPRRLKLGTHVDIGQMYHVYRNQAAAAYLSHYFSQIFSNEIFRHFSRELWGLEDWKVVHTWTVGRCIICTGIRLLLLIHPFFHFSFSPIFNIEIFHHTFLRNCEA